jgi:2-polyprenyl-6-methoxyphenol hydroxylase-like FAD-dependent oxidoreductase
MQRLDIAIAGAGFAGLASAALLARDGHRVTVYEKFEQAGAPGAGILVQPSGLAALRVLGIEDAILRHGARIEHLRGVTPSGRRVVDIDYGDWQPGAFGIGLHRGVLFDALWRLAQAEGARVLTGQECTDLAALKSRHALVVVADGCRSRLRVQSGLACSDRVYPWGAVWAVLADPGASHGDTLWQWYRGAGQMLGIMPTGRAPGADLPVVSLFWSLHASRLEAWRDAGVEAFKQQLRALNPACEALLAQITSLEQLTWARYHDVVMPAYHGDGCVVIGDAAHATSPQLGQGTNLALLDAVALREALHGESTLPRALERYTAMRRAHSHFYGQASRWLTPWFQSDLRLLPWLRDMFMAWGGRLPVTGRIARQTLVGVQAGWKPGTVLALPGDAAAPAQLAAA